MDIRNALKKYRSVEADLLLENVLGKSREFLFMNGDDRLTRTQADRLTRMVKRRLRGEPIAYIIGYRDFYGLRFKVNRDVLISRPETEIIVDRVIASAAEEPLKKNIAVKGSLRSRSDALTLGRDDKVKILDVGTGSGNIIISIAKQLKNFQFPISNFQFYASDISQKALIVAKQNAKNHRVKIKFIRSDLLNRIKVFPDIIIANLPYLSVEWKSESLKYEPKSALFAEKKGLAIIGKLLAQISALKHRPKLVYLEFDPRQKRSLSALIKKHLPKADVKFHKDFGGHWRVAEIEI